MNSLLYAVQGEMIDNIEKNVNNAVEYVGQAKVETKKAGEVPDADTQGKKTTIQMFRSQI